MSSAVPISLLADVIAAPSQQLNECCDCLTVDPQSDRDTHSHAGAAPSESAERVLLEMNHAEGTSQELSAPSPGDDLRLKLAIRLRGQTLRSDSFWETGCDFSAVKIRLRLRCILR